MLFSEKFDLKGEELFPAVKIEVLDFRSVAQGSALPP